MVTHRVDLGATTLKALPAGCPSWDTVVRRTTRDLYTRKVLVDENNTFLSKARHDEIVRPIPGGKHDIETRFEFTHSS